MIYSAPLALVSICLTFDGEDPQEILLYPRGNLGSGDLLWHLGVLVPTLGLEEAEVFPSH